MDLDTITGYRPAPGATWQPGDAWLGGGTWLFGQPQPGLRRLLDLRGFGWVPLTQTRGRPGDRRDLHARRAGRVAPGRRRAPAATGTVAWPAVPLLRQCCEALLASFKVQNMATVGGNICLALPAGAMTSLAASLDGVATVWSPGGGVREVPVTDLVTGPGTTGLGPGELLRSAHPPGRVAARPDRVPAGVAVPAGPVGRPGDRPHGRPRAGHHRDRGHPAARPAALRRPGRPRTRPWPPWTRRTCAGTTTCTGRPPGGPP